MYSRQIAAIRLIPIIALIAAISIFTWTRPIFGQVTAASYDGTGAFTFNVQSMPDLDQERDGLAFDGVMFCIPASCMNLCAYAANFGFPGLLPGPGVWQGQQGHQLMTGYLNLMGHPSYMNTDPDPDSENGGTSGTNKINGMEEWIFDYGQPLHVQTMYPKNGNWPTIDDAAIHAINGAILQISYGRYDWQPILDRPFLTNRDGGHGVTLKLAFANNGLAEGPRLIHYRDPGSDEGNLFSNSLFTSTATTSAANIKVGTTIYGQGFDDYTVTALEFAANPSSRYKIMDSFLALYPNGGLVFDGVQVNPMFVNGNLGFVQDQLPVPFNAPLGHSIVVAIPHPQVHSSIVLTKAVNGTASKLYQVFHGGRFNLIADVPPTTQHIEDGPSNTILIGEDIPGVGQSVAQIDLTTGEISAASMLPSGSAPINAIAYDRDSDIGYVVAGRKIHQYDPNTGQISFGLTIVGAGNSATPIRSLVVSNGQFHAALATNRIGRATVPAFTRAFEFPFQQLALDGVLIPLSVDVDSNWRMYVSDQVNGLREFVEKQNKDWVPAANPLYHFPLQGRRFVVFKNQSNIRRGDLDESQWYNIAPSELDPIGVDIPD